MRHLYSQIAKKIIFPLADLTMGTQVMSYYKLIEKMKTWSSEEIELWQNRNLHKIISYAYDKTEYYKELFDKIGIKPDDIKTKSDLSKIPILTREELITNYARLTSKDIKLIPAKIGETGGTTGTPMKYILDYKSWSYSNADYIYNWEKSNYYFGDKYISLGHNSIFAGKDVVSLKHKLFYKLKGKIELNGMDMTDDVLKGYLKFIETNRIKYIYGYASSIYLLAKYVLENDIRTNIRACFPTSEILLDTYRKTILEAFECKIINCYGAHDAGITAFEHQHKFFEVGYNTIIRVKESKKELDLSGPIIVTNLLNFAMPMINYQLGDEIKMNKEIKNYNGQVIERVIGRTPDIIRLENGNVLTGFSFYEQIFGLPVKEWKLRKNGKNTLLCEVLKLPEFNLSHEKILINKLQEYGGKDSIIQVAYVEKFELTRSGKRKHYIR